MSDRPAVTATIICARPDGLVLPLEYMAKQKLDEPWELLIVNWGFGEQDELIRALWRTLRPDVPLRHVPLLAPLPINNGVYNSWHMGVSFNTAWTHALGEFIAVIEDFWMFQDTWLQDHLRLQREVRGSEFIVGYNHSDPHWDLAAPWHYGIPAIIMCNFSHRTEAAWYSNGLGAPEWPTRHPEITILPNVFGNRGYTAVRKPVHAWHQTHYPDGCFAQIMQKRAYIPGEAYYHPDGRSFDGMFTYVPVERLGNAAAYSLVPPADLTPYRRNIREERQKFGYWV